MKKKIDSAKIKRFLASFFIYLMVFSPFSIGQGESGAAVNQETNLPTEFPAENIQDVFENNPTPENFNKLPNPTAADLELVQNPTPENFNHLDSSEQGTYLSNEDNFRQDFAGEYYSDPANWGANPEADKILFAGTRFRDLLKAGTSQVSAAEQYFSDNFGAPYTLAIVADDFIFDQENRILKNGKTNLKLDDYTGDSTITEIKATADGFEISRKAEENEQVISVSGEEEKSVSYDSEKGTFAFQLPEGKPHTFNVPAAAKVKFAFDKDKITITGPASGIFESANDYVQFDNHAGILVINDNGNIEAENAEVITSLLYMDGRFVKTGSQIKAWDVGSGGKQTIVVDKNSCPVEGGCIGVSTLGQWDERLLAPKDKNRAGTLEINLDEIDSSSSFYVPSGEPQTNEQKTEQLRQQATELRKPREPPLSGKDAHVWIHKNQQSGEITVTSKGVVEVGLYDARGDAASPVKDDFRYKGVNGLSELDMQFGPRTQTNVRGQAELKNSEFRGGILTNQDGAVFKITNDNFGLTQNDIFRADCFDCQQGEAIVIQKSIAIAQKTSLAGIFSESKTENVKLVITVDENGRTSFKPDLTDLGYLASQVPKDNAQVSMGRNFFMSVPCGNFECNFKLTTDPRTGDPGAAYEIVDPLNPAQPLQRIDYPLTAGKMLGGEIIVVSQENVDNVNKLADLIESGNFNQLSELEFDENDPQYSALRKKILLETGINLDEISDPKYVSEINEIVTTAKRSRDNFRSLGIEVDANGNPLTLKDQQRMREILSKNGGAEFDLLTRAQLDLARTRIKEVAAQLSACQGDVYCSVKMDDLKKAQADAGKIQKQREGAYERWQAAERKAQLEKQINEARERQKSPDKGIDDIDKRESIDIGNKIVAANKQRTDLQRRVESSRENFVNFRDELRKNIEAELSTAQKIGIDWDKFRYDTDYVAAVLRDFRLTDAEFKVGFEDVKFYYDQYNQFTEESNSLDQNLKDWNSQQEALITKYRWEGKDDAAAEIALLSKQYGEANEIIQASPLLPPEVRINLGARAQQQITEESLNQVSILYNYGYGDQAGQMLLSLENAAPEIKESVEYQKAVKSQLKFAQGVVEEKIREEEQLRYREMMKRFDEKFSASVRFSKALKNINFNPSFEEYEEGVFGKQILEVIGSGFSATFQSSEEVGAEILGGLANRETLRTTTAKLDEQAAAEHNRQIENLYEIRNYLKAYDVRGSSAIQAFADAQSGISGEQVLISDDPTAAYLQFQLTGEVFSAEDKERLARMDNPLDRLAFTTQKEEEYSDTIKELEFNKLARDAENAIMFNRGKMAGEPEAKMREAISVCPECSGAENFQQRVNQLDESVTKEIFGETFGGAFEWAGVTYTQRTEEEFRDMAIASLDATILFDIAEIGLAPLAIIDAVNKVKFLKNAVKLKSFSKARYVERLEEAFGTAADVAIYASRESRAALDAAKAAQRSANTADAIVEARKSVDFTQRAIEAEVEAGLAAKKYTEVLRAGNPSDFDLEALILRNRGVNNIYDETKILNQAQRELDAAKKIGDVAAEQKALAAISQSQDTLQQAKAQINYYDNLLQASKIAGPEKGKIRQLWDNTFGQTIGVRNGLKFGSAGEEVIAAEKNFRVAAQIFNEAKINARLIGDTAEAAVSRARLARAEDTLLKAADEVDTAYLIRKGEIGRSVIKSRLQQARAASLSAKSDELLAAIDSEGITKLDNLLYNPVLRLVPDGAGLRFAVSEDASPALKQSAMEGNELLAKADEATLAEGAITSSARAEGEVELVLLEGLADSEFAIANEVKSKRIQAATGEFVLEEAPQRKIINNELVEPCNLAAAAIYGLAIPCVEPKGVTKTAEVPETPLSEESTRLAEEVAVVERATIPPPDIATLQKPTKEGLEHLIGEAKIGFKKYNAGRRQLGLEPDKSLDEFVKDYVGRDLQDAGIDAGLPDDLVGIGISKTGDEKVDAIIDVLEGRTSGELDAEELRKLEIAESLKIGQGAEGIVYALPDGSVIKVKNTDSAISMPFREQARRLNALCEKGLAPCVSRSGEYFYQSERARYNSVQDAVLERLSEEGRREYLEVYDLRRADRITEDNYIELRAAVIQRARDEGRLNDLELAADDFFNSLKESNLEILDPSWKNLHCANEECTKFLTIDVGFSVTGERSKILLEGVAENYKNNLLNGKGQIIGGERGQELIDEAAEILRRERDAGKGAPAAGEAGQIRPLTEAEIQDPQELEAWNEIAAAARFSEERLSLEQVNRLEDNRLSIPEDDFYAITFDVPKSARQSLGFDVGAVIKVQSDTPPQGVALVTDEADILSDLSEVAVPVLLRDDRYYVVQKFEGLRLDEMSADLRAKIRPQIESFREALVAKGYEMDNYGGLVYDSLKRELRLINPRVVKKSSLPPDELRDLHNQKIDDILNRGVVTPEEKAEALAEARRILEEEGAFARPPVENVVVPQEAAATDLGSANAGQNVKIRSREDLYEGSLLSKEGDNIIIETTEPRGGIFGAILPDRKIQQQIPLEDVIIYGEQVHIRSVSKRGVNRQELIGDVYVGNYLGENNAYLYLSVNGKPTRIHKANLDLGSLDKAIVSDPASEFILNQQKILDQVNRVPIVDGRQVLIVHVDPNSLRIQGVGAVPSEVSGNSVPVRMVIDAETGRIADVVGEERIAKQYRGALVNKPLYEELSIVRRDIVNGCAIAGSAIHGLALPCADVAVGRLEAEVPVPVESGVGITGPTLDPELRKWKEGVSGNNLENIVERGKTLSPGQEFQVGEDIGFSFITKDGEAVEAVERLKYGPSGFTIEVRRADNNEYIASHDYQLIMGGDRLGVESTYVVEKYQEAGINQRIFQQMSEIHSNVPEVEASLGYDNRLIYGNFIINNPDATALDALKQTPAHKIRERTGWEVDLEKSNLPNSIVYKRAEVAPEISPIRESIPPEVSGVMIVSQKGELSQIDDVGIKELPVINLEEELIPEEVITVNNVIAESDGIVVRSNNNLYFISDEGIYPVGMDKEYSFRPKKAGGQVSLPPEQESALKTIYGQVKLNQRDAQVLNQQDKFGLLLIEAAKDKKIQIQTGSGALDHLMINSHGSHDNYLKELDRVIENNDNLKYLHEQFRQQGIEPLTTVKNPYPDERLDIAATYNPRYEAVDGSFVEGSFTYRIFATEEELLDYTRRITGREIEDVEEAKKLIAESQVKGVAGHEAAHHAFYRMLDEEERIFFTDYVWSTDDEALVKAREFIGSRPVYAKTSEISEELYQSIIANEVFAYRLDFNMQGIGLHSDLNVLPSERELAIFEQFEVLPPKEKRIPALVNNIALQPPQSFADITAEGQWFRARLNDGTSVEGRFSRIEGDEIVFTRYERREGLLSWFLDDKIEPGTRISRNDFEPSSLIVGGRTNVRFSTSKGTFYGRYSGDSPDGIKILDSSGNEIIVPRKGLIKDSVVAQGEVIEIKAVDNVAAYNGRYLAETDTEIYLDVDGKVTKLSKNNLDLTTLQKKEFAEELGVPPVSAEAGVGLGEQILDVLPADFKRETSAVYKSEGLFELNGKIYRRGSEGNWKQKREGFWSFLGDKDISDEEYFDVAEELNIAESNAFPQKTAAKVPSETYSAPEVFTGGQMVPDKEIAEFFDNADINCPTGGALVGQAAAGPCNFEISTGRKRLSNLKEGDEVRLVSLRGNHYYGEFIFADENTLLLRLPDSTQNQIRLDRIDLNSLVSQDNFVRIIRTDGTSAFGKYAGEGEEYIRLIDANRNIILLDKNNLRYDSLVSAGDEIEMTSLRGSSIKGVFSSESETHIFYLDENGFPRKAGKDQLADVKRIIYEPLAADEISSDFIIDNQQLFAKNPSYALGLDEPASEPIAYKKIMFSDGIRREVHYSLNDLKIAEDVGLIYENVPPARLKRGQGYTYVVLNDGSLVFGEVHDGLEFGVKHLHLANGKPVKAAGEIFIDESGRYLFNLESGSFTLVLRREYRVSEGLLREQMHDVFYRYFGQDGNYIKAVINKPVRPSLDELADLCFKNQGIRLPICGSNRDIKQLIEEKYPGWGVSEAVEPCAVAGKAIFGLAPCLSSSRNIIDLDEAEPIPLERIISTERISGIKATLTDPTSLMVPGEDDWNDMVTIIKKHEKETALSESDLEELIENSGGYIGRGAEGVVLAVPEEVRVALGINKPAVIKIRNYIKPTVEDVANTFPEQAELLNSMAGKGVAPEVYKSGENYYIDEKLEGETIRNLMYKSLSPEQLKAYKLAKDDKEKKLILATALSPEQKAQLNILLDELTDTLAESGVAIDDFHGGNVMLVQTPEGTKAKVVDLGYAYTDDSETLRTLYDIKKRKLMAAGGYEADAEKLIKIRVTQRRAAENTIDFSSDFPLETEALEIAEVRQLKSALRAISVENEKVFSYIVSAGEGQRVRRIYEANLDPLGVALKLDAEGVSHSGEGIFEYRGNKFIRDQEAGWVEKRRFWFDKKADADTAELLDAEKSRLLEEGLFPLPEVRLGSCPRAGGAIVGGAGQVPCIPFGLSLEEVVMRLPPAELPRPQVVSKVAGYDNTVSNLYDSITTENVEEIFQNKLEHLGTEIYGGKAIAYIHDDGRVQVVFLTETEKTHHRQALGTIIGGEKGKLVYEGQYDNYLIGDLTERSFGFSFQYDKSTGKIIGIQASSQISNLQKSKGATGWTLPEPVISFVEQEMLERIDLDLIDEFLVDSPINEWIDKNRLPVAAAEAN